MYNDILEMIQSASDKDFETASKLLEEYIVDDTDFIGTLKQIGTICRNEKTREIKAKSGRM